MASNKEMRLTFEHDSAWEASSVEIIVFPRTWSSNIKAETRGTYTGKFSQQFYNPISYFLRFMCTSFWLSWLAFGYNQCQLQRIWEKQIYKNTSEYYHCLYFYRNPLSASAVKSQETKYICEQHINTTSNISRDHICKEWRPWKNKYMYC